MPYISSEKVKQIREAIKAQFPQFTFSITRSNSSGIDITLLSGPVDFGKDHASVNHFYIADHYTGEAGDTLQKIYEIANEGNETESTDGDYGNIPRFYVTMAIGSYDRKYTITEAVKETSTAPVNMGSFKVEDYSDKAIVVRGDTKPIKDDLRALGGRFNFRLKGGAGWIFPKTKQATVTNKLQQLAGKVGAQQESNNDAAFVNAQEEAYCDNRYSG